MWKLKFVFSKALALFCMSRFVQKIFAIKSGSRRKTEQIYKFIGPYFFGGCIQTVLRRQIFCATYRSPFGKVLLSSLWWCQSAKPGNKVESRINVGWVKMTVQFGAVCGPKFMTFRYNGGDPLLLSTHMPIMYIMFRSEDIGC